MKRHFPKAAKFGSLLVLCSIALLYLMRSRPVLLRIPPDDTIRPRYYCLLNPFRDTAPEKTAEQYLTKLRDGAVEEISPFVGDNKYILEREREWPIESWRIGNRTDETDNREITYWVMRGNGYSKDGYEEEVIFDVACSERGCKVNTYSAIY
jgi:hypothetical protein